MISLSTLRKTLGTVSITVEGAWVVDQRSETRTRQESRDVEDVYYESELVQETWYEDSEGRRNSAITPHYEDVRKTRTTSEKFTIEYQETTSDILFDGGHLLKSLENLDAEVGDRIYRALFEDTVTGKCWSLARNECRLKVIWDTSIAKGILEQECKRMALDLISDLEAQQREVLAGRKPKLNPLKIAHDKLLIEGTVGSFYEGGALVTNPDYGTFPMEGVGELHGVREGDLIQILVRIKSGKVFSSPWILHLPRSSVTCTNATNIEVRHTKDTVTKWRNNSYFASAAGLLLLFGWMVGMIMGIGPSAWIAGISGTLLAAWGYQQRMRDDRTLEEERRRVAEVNCDLTKARKQLAEWNWRRIRDNI